MALGTGDPTTFGRRDLLRTGVFAGAALALPAVRAVGATTQNRIAESRLPAPFTTPFLRPPDAVPVRSTATCDYYRMEMRAVQADVIPGYKTVLFGYNGSVPGPTINAWTGRQTVVRHINSLPSVHPTLGYVPWTAVHLHGSASLPQYDGYASDITYPGEYKDYHYPNHQQARTMWYHDHGLHHTAENAYHGLAGMYLLRDAEEQALPLPKGEYDVPLLITDAMFATDGNLLFSLDDHSGHWGDVIMVNGRPWPVMKVQRRKYRFRVCVASLSRSFHFSFSNRMTYQVIGTDGGLMPAPVTVSGHRQSSGERYEIVVDFSKVPVGSRVVLGNTSPKNNRDYTHTNKVMAFDVVGDRFSTVDNSVPPVLSRRTEVMGLQPSQSVATRTIDLVRTGGEWTVNKNTWRTVIDSGYTHVEASPRLHSTEIWDLRNSSGGWFHPTHIHLVDFKILSRNGRPPHPWELGPKDTVYLGENETVRVLMRFDHVGKYMIHCHNLLHEDHDMMSQFEVVSPDAVGDDPIRSAAPKSSAFEALDVL
ncbi:MAG: hypothetical protein RI900_2091 [Actinomycetota bacterium]